LLSEKICDQDEGEKTIDALQNAIKALEQEPILDNIRAEIKAMIGDFETISDVLDIIDKYRSESEVKHE
jgi:hypothetical protein